MAALNRAAAEVMRRAGAHAGTDVTGFGLLGHLWQVARESGVTAELWWDAVPALAGGARMREPGIVSGAAERNREFAGPAVTVAAGVPEYARTCSTTRRLPAACSCWWRPAPSAKLSPICAPPAAPRHDRRARYREIGGSNHGYRKRQETFAIPED